MANGNLLEGVGLALSGFGAGVGGQLPQFQQQLERRQQFQQRDIEQARAQDIIKTRGLLERGDIAGAANIWQNRIDSGTQGGMDMQNSQNVMQAILTSQSPQDTANVIGELNDDLLSLVNRGSISGEGLGLSVGGTTSGEKTRAALLADLRSEDPQTAKSAEIALGLSPRAVGSAIQTITQRGTAEEVGDTEATISQRRKFGELTGTSRAKTIDSGFDSITKINKNIRNMGRAIAAIDEGASTGVIESRFFPSFKKATLQLEALQKELALDVIGSVTFGALSQGELDLAQEVALPTNLEPADLRQHLVDRTAAQEKLRGYYQDQIDFLDQGGTIAGFLRSRGRDEGGTTQQGGAPETAQVAEGATATNPQTGETIVFRGGQWQAQ